MTREDLEARAKKLGIPFSPNIGDAKLQAKIDAKLEEAPAELPEAMVRVQCAVANGRRRGGRAWQAGLTELPVSECTDEMLAALEGDPMFTVTILPGEAPASA